MTTMTPTKRLSLSDLPHLSTGKRTHPIAYQYTLPVPLMVLAFALFTIGWRLRTFDPVAIVERRIV